MPCVLLYVGIHVHLKSQLYFLLNDPVSISACWRKKDVADKKKGARYVLKKLLETKPLGSISIVDITQDYEVNRQMF